MAQAGQLFPLGGRVAVSGVAAGAELDECDGPLYRAAMPIGAGHLDCWRICPRFCLAVDQYLCRHPGANRRRRITADLAADPQWGIAATDPHRHESIMGRITRAAS